MVTVTKNVGGGKVEGEDDGEMKKKEWRKTTDIQQQKQREKI